MAGAIGILPLKFQCINCGWMGRLVIEEIIEIQKNKVEKKIK